MEIAGVRIHDYNFPRLILHFMHDTLLTNQILPERQQVLVKGIHLSEASTFQHSGTILWGKNFEQFYFLHM